MDWGVVATIGAVVVSIAAIVVGLRAIWRKKPVWAYITSKIIGLDTDAPAGLKLSFNEKPVRDAYRTTFIFFNKGRETIRENDVAADIAIHFKEATILQPPVILKSSNAAIKFSAKQTDKGGDNAIKLSFDYLDHNDGAVVEVLHTKSQEITRSGTIKGADRKRIDYIGEFLPPRPLKLRGLLLGYGMLVLFGLFGGVMWFITGDVSLLIIFLVFFLPIGLLTGISTFRRYIKFPKWSGTVEEKGAQRLS